MQVNNKRLLLEYEQAAKSINREVINPEITELELEQLRPILAMIAKARADYLKTLFTEATSTDQELNVECIKNLKQKREIYEELLKASEALRTAIERGYIDVVNTDSQVA